MHNNAPQEIGHLNIQMAKEQAQNLTFFVPAHVSSYDPYTHRIKAVIPTFVDQQGNFVESGWIQLGTAWSGKNFGIQIAPFGGATVTDLTGQDNNPNANPEQILLMLVGRDETFYIAGVFTFNNVDTPPGNGQAVTDQWGNETRVQLQSGEAIWRHASGSYALFRNDGSISFVSTTSPNDPWKEPSEDSITRQFSAGSLVNADTQVQNPTTCTALTNLQAVVGSGDDSVPDTATLAATNTIAATTHGGQQVTSRLVLNALANAKADGIGESDISLLASGLNDQQATGSISLKANQDGGEDAQNTITMLATSEKGLTNNNTIALAASSAGDTTNDALISFDVNAKITGGAAMSLTVTGTEETTADYALTVTGDQSDATITNSVEATLGAAALTLSALTEAGDSSGSFSVTSNSVGVVTLDFTATGLEDVPVTITVSANTSAANALTIIEDVSASLAAELDLSANGGTTGDIFIEAVGASGASIVQSATGSGALIDLSASGAGGAITATATSTVEVTAGGAIFVTTPYMLITTGLLQVGGGVIEQLVKRHFQIEYNLHQHVSAAPGFFTSTPDLEMTELDLTQQLESS